MEQRIEEEIITVPGKPRDASEWKLGYSDRAMAPHQLRGVWIFREHLDVKRLKQGFRELLVFYPHITGRVAWKKKVKYSTKGISFSLCHMPYVSIETVARDRTITDRFVTTINKRKMKSGNAPLVTIRLTYCADGCVLGVVACHLVMDGASFYGFVNNWAKCCRGETVIPPVIRFLHFDSIDVSRKELIRMACEKGFTRLTLSDMALMLRILVTFKQYNERVGPFHITDEALKRCKNEVTSAVSFTCSTNEVLSAFIAQQCIQLLGHSSDIQCGITHVIDLRKRIPGIPVTFCGNASYVAVNSNRFPADASAGMIASSIHKTLTPLISTPSADLEWMMAVGMDIIRRKVMVFPGDFAGMFSRRPTNFYINNFLNLPVYEVDFGVGTAETVIPHDLPDPVLFWPAPPEKGGAEIYFTGMLARSIKSLPSDSRWLERFNNKLK